MKEALVEMAKGVVFLFAVCVITAICCYFYVALEVDW